MSNNCFYQNGRFCSRVSFPEKKFEFYGENGLFEFTIERVKKRGHCIIVVAEGCEEAILDVDLKNCGNKDMSGNKVFVVSI